MTQPEAIDTDLLPPGCGLFFRWLFATILGMGIGWAAGWQISFQVPGALASAALGLSIGLVLGLFQGWVLRNHLHRPWIWVVVTGLGWAAGLSLGAWIAQHFGFSDILFGLFTGLVTGLVVGAAQWVFLQKRVTSAGWWILASTFAWTASLLFYQPGVSWLGFYYGTLSGIVTGIAILWLVYRPVPDVEQPANPE